MSKKTGIDTALDELMSSAPVQNKATEKHQSTGYTNEKSTTISIRILKEDRDKLNKHFKLKGYISTSVGIRELVYKYMDEKGLL